jgi:hypothetical protein
MLAELKLNTWFRILTSATGQYGGAWVYWLRRMGKEKEGEEAGTPGIEAGAAIRKLQLHQRPQSTRKHLLIRL